MEKMLSYAVEQWGKDRYYTVRFGGSGAIILCREPDGTPIAEVWQAGDEIKTRHFKGREIKTLTLYK